MYRITFADGRTLNASEDHPIYIEGKGYAAMNPDPNISYKDLGVAEQLEIGDKAIDQDGNTNEIVKVELIDFPGTVYTFGNSKFFANGMLVY